MGVYERLLSAGAHPWNAVKGFVKLFYALFFLSDSENRLRKLCMSNHVLGMLWANTPLTICRAKRIISNRVFARPLGSSGSESG